MRTKSKPTTTRINVSLPDPLLQDLRELIPPRARNQFIVELIEREVKRRKLLEALEISAGAWSDEDYPHLKTVEDVDRWVRALREANMPRTWDEIIGEATSEDVNDERLSAGHEHSRFAVAG